MATRKNSDILKGSKLMVFLGGNPIGFATSHALSMTVNTTEISTKDHGDYPAVLAQSISWEVTAENLYSDAGEATYMGLMLTKTPVSIEFAQASNYSNTDEKGIIDVTPAKTWSAGTIIASGKALITSFSINAPAGDNATMSVTFTGVGALTQPSSNDDNNED
jgi:hypothetical protein